MDVTSAAIRRIRYDERAQKLYVRFVDGDEYLYVGVPSTVNQAFREADSKGQYFAKAIRDRYPYNKLN
ncbi:KTSC domain-containing protein [Caulobacter sp. KR2-114]|uniref:KTSC domain-containing protein n=1 Tax=Caulobacter sp. KR2-114 TaxID=3400912 RepID=UPI003C07B376